jgi:hypothetical protein
MIRQWAKPFTRIDDLPDDDLLWRIEWIGGVQHERSERPPNRRLPGAASCRRDGSAQREIAFLSNEESGEDRCWLATLRLNCFGMAAAAGAKQP